MLNISGIKKLMVAAELKSSAVAEHTGIPIDTFNAIMQGKLEPSVVNLTKIADYFAVPLDFLVGRCTKEQADAVLKDYSKHFMQLRRISFEEYLSVKNKLNLPTTNINAESPYPYNLYEAVLNQPVDWIITSMQEEGLEWALSTLTEREENYIRLYYQAGINLSKIGKKYSVSRERVRQVIAKGVRKLSHPSRKTAILGKYRTIEEAEKKMQELVLMAEDYEKKANELMETKNLVFIREQKIF